MYIIRFNPLIYSILIIEFQPYILISSNILVTFNHAGYNITSYDVR